MSPAQDLLDNCRRIFVILVGGTVHERASICHYGSKESVHIEPVAAAGELGLRDLTNVDVFLVWDEDDAIGELKSQLSIIGRWCPIVAISERPSAARVVSAVRAGAMEYVDWAGDFTEVQNAIAIALEAKGRMLPLKQRQTDAQRLVHKLSSRERQVLMAMAQGMSNKDIARLLKISPRTVEIHRANMMHKIHAANSADAVRIALEAASAAMWIAGDNWAAPWTLEDLLPHSAGPNSGNDNE